MNYHKLISYPIEYCGGFGDPETTRRKELEIDGTILELDWWLQKRADYEFLCKCNTAMLPYMNDSNRETIKEIVDDLK